MKKKLLAIVLSATVMASCFAMFAACGTTDEPTQKPENSETGNAPEETVQVDTFEGTISAESYDSAENAAIAFLENEVNGNTVQAEFVTLEIKCELNDGEIEALALSVEEKSGLVKAEDVVIVYRVTDAEVASLAALSDDSYTQRVYLLTYANGAFRYFVPAPEIGENLTKSYFEDVLDSSKYLNVTYDFKSTWYENEEWKNWDATAKLDENAVYEQDNYVYSDGETKYFELYRGIFDGVFVSASYENEWNVSSRTVDEEYRQSWSETLADMGSVVLRRWLGASIDYTFFVKTDSGFALRSDKICEFLAAMGEENENFEENDFSIGELTAEYSVFVLEGRVDTVTYMYEYGTYKGSYRIECTDFGKTVITLPDEVKAKIQIS